MLKHFMQQLEKELDLEEPFLPSVDGIYEYVLDDDLVILLSPLQEGLQLNARLGPLPAEAGEEFYINMLSGNLFGQNTYNACLGISTDGKQMLLSKVAAYQVNYQDFRLLLEDFINVLLYWRKQAGL